jgi:hypothetical protein
LSLWCLGPESKDETMGIVSLAITPQWSAVSLLAHLDCACGTSASLLPFLNLHIPRYIWQLNGIWCCDALTQITVDGSIAISSPV